MYSVVTEINKNGYDGVKVLFGKKLDKKFHSGNIMSDFNSAMEYAEDISADKDEPLVIVGIKMVGRFFPQFHYNEYLQRVEKSSERKK